MTRDILKLLASDNDITDAMERVRSLLRKSEFGAASRESVQVLVRQPSYLPALVTLALSIQLEDDERKVKDFSLGDARAALQKASALQVIAGDASHELARFLYAVDDQSALALEVVDRAVQERAAQLQELLLAKVEILRDLQQQAAAEQVSRAALRMFADDTEFRRRMSEEP